MDERSIMMGFTAASINRIKPKHSLTEILEANAMLGLLDPLKQEDVQIAKVFICLTCEASIPNISDNHTPIAQIGNKKLFLIEQ
jgi:hypothetical protein